MKRNNRTVPSDQSQSENETSSPKQSRKNSLDEGLKKASSQESLEEFGEPLKFDPDFSGPIKKRVCTGALCVI